MQIKTIANGVEACFINTDKFKTSRISINMFIDADEKDVSAYALLQMILTTSTNKYPDYTSLNKALNELYGASLYSDIIKFGDMRVVKFVIAFLDDKFAFDNSNVSKKAVDLLLSAVFNPALYDGKFKESVFLNNKRLLIENISGEINDKRRYAIVNTEKLMYNNEPAGISRYGDIKTAESLTNDDLISAHKKLLENAFVRVNVISQSNPDGIFESIAKSFEKLNRNVEKCNTTVFHKSNGKINEQNEQLDVTQGKLCLGFTLQCDGSREDVAKSAVFVDMYGGGPYSKLFTNVREKQSLCYYCAARFDSRKSTFIVDSGVLEENKDKAYNGILEQLEEIKKGNFTEQDLLASKMSMIDALASVSDLSANLDNWYSMLSFEAEETTETYSEKINAVTIQDIIDKANSVTLDTVYFLGGLNKGGK